MTEHAYRARIKAWIDSALSKRRLSLNELIRHLPGVHPDIVAAHVRGDERLAGASEVAVSAEPPHALRFPVPHPLDYDWRFVESSRQLLLDRAVEFTSAGDRVILLGAPTVFRAALERKIPRAMTLVEGNGFIVESKDLEGPRSVLRINVTQEDIPPLRGKVIITDPPWYEEYSKAFLWAAARVTIEGGWSCSVRHLWAQGLVSRRSGNGLRYSLLGWG